MFIHPLFTVGQDGAMAKAPVILLPPSEGKASGGTGPAVDLDSLSFPELEAERTTVCAALGTAMKKDEASRSKLLGVKASALVAATAANRGVLTAPTMPAIERYTGVLYDALDVDSLSSRDRKRLDRQVLIFSGLWGVVRPNDLIPDYKLKMGATLARLGKLSTWWRATLSTTISATVDGTVVWNLLPKEHDNAWTPAVPDGRSACGPSAIISVRFLDEGAAKNGVRSFTTVNHWNKLLKGALVRFVIETGADEPAALGRFRHPEGYRFDASLTEVTSSGTVVSMVRTAR